MRQKPGRILLSHPLIPETFGAPVERAEKRLDFYLGRGWQLWPGEEPEPDPEPKPAPKRKSRKTKPAAESVVSETDTTPTDEEIINV